MRITTNMQYRNLLSALRQMDSRSATLARQAASGRRVERPSDDPVAAARLSTLSTRIARLAQIDRSAPAGQTASRLVETALDAITSLVIDARQLATAGASDTTVGTRPIMADEIDGILQQIMAAAAVQEDGRYLMSGTLTDRPPFDAGGTYQGNLTALTAEIEEGQRVDVAPTAAEALQGIIDLPASLRALSTALRTDDKAGIQTAITDLQAALDQIGQTRARLGSSLSRIGSGLLRRAEERLVLQTEISGLGDASLPEVFVELAQIDQARQAALATAARIGQRNLFSFIA